MLNPFDSASGCLLALKAKKVKPKPKRSKASKVWSVSTGVIKYQFIASF